MVLLMYLLSLHESHVMAALVGHVAVIFRQTNIVWVFFTGKPDVRMSIVYQ